METENKRKKILVMVDWFKPGYKAGGPIRSTVNFAFALKKDFDIWVLTTDTDHGGEEPYSNIPTNEWITNLDPAIKVYYARKSTLNLAQLKKVILAADADYVYLNHLYSPKFVVYPLWLKYKKVLKSSVVLCPRGALYDSALAVKKFKKKPFIQLFRWLGIHKRITFHATNEREEEAIHRFFPGSKVIIADNLPDPDQPPFISCNKETGILRCIFIARIVPIKNLLFLLQLLKSVKGKVHLSVVGPVEDKNYWKECEAAIQELPENVPVNYMGAISNAELTGIVQAHHLFVLPTTGENFGHSIFEALLAGRPVLISDQTPWLNLCNRKAGWDLPLNNPEGFTRIIDEIAAWDQYRFNEWSQGAWQFANQFINNPALKKQYLELFP